MVGFVEVKEPRTEKLLFRYDACRDLIEIKRRGVKVVIDLRQYRGEQEAIDKPGENVVG